MKNFGRILKGYWNNLNDVASGDWTFAFGIAFCIGIVLVFMVALVGLIAMLGLIINYPYAFIPLLLIFVVYRLGYAAVKGE